MGRVFMQLNGKSGLKLQTFNVAAEFPHTYEK